MEALSRKKQYVKTETKGPKTLSSNLPIVLARVGNIKRRERERREREREREDEEEVSQFKKIFLEKPSLS